MIEITKENIDKIQVHRYFDNNEINKEIYNKTLLLMGAAHSYGGNETLLLMDNRTYQYRITTQLNESKVVFDKEMLDALRSNSDYTFTAFHNHPTDSSFSLGDVITFLEHEKIILLVLCTNSCKYNAALFKTKNCSKKVIKIIYYLIKRTTSFKPIKKHLSGMKLIEWLCKHGFLYVQYINY